MRKFEGRSHCDPGRSSAGFVVDHHANGFSCPECGGLTFLMIRDDGDLFFGAHGASGRPADCPLGMKYADDVIAWRLDCLLDLLEGSDGNV